MKGKARHFLSIFAVIAFLYWTAGSGCAVQVPPSGGPRDSLPPNLISVKPIDSSVNFLGKKIVFQFDEYVQLDKPTENLIVNPTPKINPRVEGHLSTVTVTIKDTLQPNTTYSFDFGKTIKDVNEGNVLKDFRYVFSTGPSIDTFTLSGQVIDAQSGIPDSTLIVELYSKTDDSAVTKEKPVYVTRLNGKGIFTFHFLHPGSYALYALKDEGGTRRYLSKQQKFAFADAPVQVGDSSKAVTLYAYVEEDKEKEKKPTVAAPAAKKNNKEKEKKDDILRIASNLDKGTQDLLDSFKLFFRPDPLKNFDSSKIRFTDEKFETLPNAHFIPDSNISTISLGYNWTENTAYNIIIDKDFGEDTLGRKLLRNDTLSFRTRKIAEYGLLRLRFPGLDLSKHPLLLFIQNNAIKEIHRFTSNEYYAKLFRPGDYELRIVYDENQNGRWDAGEFFGVHRQPERVLPISRKLTVKANWENEVDINL